MARKSARKPEGGAELRDRNHRVRHDHILHRVHLERRHSHNLPANTRRTGKIIHCFYRPTERFLLEIINQQQHFARSYTLKRVTRLRSSSFRLFVAWYDWVSVTSPRQMLPLTSARSIKKPRNFLGRSISFVRKNSCDKICFC